jgi:hypothetical protein
MVGPIFFLNTINLERYVSDILRPFFREHYGRRKDMVILCKMVLQHTLTYSINVLNEVFEDRLINKSRIVACKAPRLKSLLFLSVGKSKRQSVFK